MSTRTLRAVKIWCSAPSVKKKPIDAEQLIDLLSWARTAAGDVTMASSDGSTMSYSIERVPASAEPTLRLTAAIRKWPRC
jgi:hypothetical protein